MDTLVTARSVHALPALPYSHAALAIHPKLQERPAIWLGDGGLVLKEAA